MALRSQFDWPVRCPKYGAIGHVWASEDDHAFRRNPHFGIEEISPWFIVGKRA